MGEDKRPPEGSGWIETVDTGTKMYECPHCHCRMLAHKYDAAVGSEGYNYCPYCGERVTRCQK